MIPSCKAFPDFPYPGLLGGGQQTNNDIMDVDDDAMILCVCMSLDLPIVSPKDHCRDPGDEGDAEDGGNNIGDPRNDLLKKKSRRRTPEENKCHV